MMVYTILPIRRNYKTIMTDKNLYEHIRKLVREQKDQQVLDVKHDNFAEEYCRF
jgi:hypothetical protein